MCGKCIATVGLIRRRMSLRPNNLDLVHKSSNEYSFGEISLPVGWIGMGNDKTVPSSLPWSVWSPALRKSLWLSRTSWRIWGRSMRDQAVQYSPWERQSTRARKFPATRLSSSRLPLGSTAFLPPVWRKHVARCTGTTGLHGDRSSSLLCSLRGSHDSRRGKRGEGKEGGGYGAWTLFSVCIEHPPPPSLETSLLSCTLTTVFAWGYS